MNEKKKIINPKLFNLLKGIMDVMEGEELTAEDWEFILKSLTVLTPKVEP